jgi:hypothetical protein
VSGVFEANSKCEVGLVVAAGAEGGDEGFHMERFLPLRRKGFAKSAKLFF